ncbi:MAG: adenylate/guanylate cyclase domain-containing protein [Actinomycetota bacterium]|nr:adenylate/guanylate cyclase domain-containing protein [Actinomycetota bacterium]
MQCTSCGSAIPAGARFCPSCGHPVALAQPEERRIVTILFADLVGFTTLAERMDPEQVKRLIDACFERLVEVVGEFGGRVDKLLGDGMLVLFGAPVAHEDDPERAVRAALRMQQTLARYVATSKLAGSDDILMRVGINTGEVLVGTLAGTDYTAMGDVVNTASRLQAAAPSGGVLVGEATHALTSHTFRYEPAGQLQPRGREQSLHAWLAMEATAPPGARRRRGEIDIVGREAELAMAEAALELVHRHGRGVLLHVNGENGVGKSRLVDEIIQRIRDRGEVSVLEGACVPYGESNVWWPIASALSTYLDIESSAPAEVVRAAALERSHEMFPTIEPTDRERLIEVFAHLMGYPSRIDKLDAATARSTIHHTVSMVLEARSRRGAMVLSVDDLHWADPVLLDLLEHLSTSLNRYSFVLITAMRPGTDVVWPPRSDRSTVISLTLQPLTRTDTDQLADALLGDTPHDDQLLIALFERSGGNPLFLLELVALTESGGGHRELPDSLRTLIAARLDQLTSEQRQMLENAAVLGTSGPITSLEKFAVELGQVFHPHVLDELDELGLLQVRGKRWEFRSDSVRDAAYQTLTKAARAQRHAGVAKAMGSSTGQIDDRAHHAAAAAELVQELGSVHGVPATIVADAVALLTAAADRAHDTGSLRLAVRHSTRALELSQSFDVPLAELAHLHLLRATAFTDQRNYQDAGADIDVLQSLADQLDDDSLRAEAYRVRGALSHVAGRIDDARRELGLAVDLLRHTNTPALLARALRVRGFIEMFGGSMVDAEWFFGEADELYRALADERGMAYIEQHRAWIAFLSGDLQAARERLTHAADTHNRQGDRNGVGWAFGLLAFVEFFERHFDEAEALAEVVGQEAALRGDEWAVGMMDTLLADLRLWQGKLEESGEFAEKARVRFKKLNDKFGTIQALAPLVRVQVAMGKYSAAQRSGEELIALADTGQHGPVPLMAVAGAAMHRGQAHAAATLAERALSEIQAAGGQAFEPMVVLALAYAQQGRIEEALVTIESVPPYGAEHPFTRAVAALVHAAAGHSGEALAHADAVTHTAGATYLDQVFAYIAAAGAAAQAGHRVQAELAAQAAVARAIGVGDVVATALATTMFGAVTGTTHPVFDERTKLGEGWVALVSVLAQPPADPATVPPATVPPATVPPATVPPATVPPGSTTTPAMASATPATPATPATEAAAPPAARVADGQAASSSAGE